VPLGNTTSARSAGTEVEICVCEDCCQLSKDAADLASDAVRDRGRASE
jgi:hypothetical protein